MKWNYNKKGNYWCASRDYDGGSGSFIYTIFATENGYTAEACNNVYGAERVAVRNTHCTKASVFSNLEKLKTNIENENIFWLYTGFCNCIGKITKEEF